MAHVSGESEVGGASRAVCIRVREVMRSPSPRTCFCPSLLPHGPSLLITSHSTTQSEERDFLSPTTKLRSWAAQGSWWGPRPGWDSVELFREIRFTRQALCDPRGRGGMESSTGWVGVFIFYVFITNHHTCSSLKQHMFTISRFPWVRSLGLG